MVRSSSSDADDQRIIDNVRDFGWHLVGVEADEEGPGFVYSVGLYQTFQHPEVVLFGLRDVSTMAEIVNAIGEEVRRGASWEDWIESDQFLGDYLCIFRKVPREHYREYFGCALWYYEHDDFPVLQCVWPDRAQQFPWNDHCAPEVRKRQPVLAERGEWPFHEGKNRAAFTTAPVLDGTRPVLNVVHNHDGDWQFLCGTTNRTEDGRLVGLQTMLELCPAIADTADLPPGWEATRTSATAPWQRSELRD